MNEPILTVQTVEKQSWMTDNEYTWAQLEEISRVNTAKRFYNGGNKTLIIVKGQDPLEKNGEPGPELLTRLRAALNMTDDCLAENTDYTIMTFGMIHKGCDHTSLAESAAKWLEDHGIPSDHIIVHSDVGGGNEEDSAAALEFANNPDYKSMHVIMSAGQYDRSRFFYISVGWQPFLHPIPFLDAPPRHSYICEFSGKYASSAYSLVNKGFSRINESTLAARERHETELADFRAQQAAKATQTKTSSTPDPDQPDTQPSPPAEDDHPCDVNTDDFMPGDVG